MIRFLRYAVEKGKKLRVVYLYNGEIRQNTASILSYTEETVVLRIGRKKAITLPLTEVLACDYARGDRGEEA